MNVPTDVKQSDTNSMSRRRRGLMGVALAGVVGAVILGTAGLTGASAAPYKAVLRVADFPNHTLTCATSAGCNAGGVGPVNVYGYLLYSKVGQWDRTVVVHCYTQGYFKITVNDVNWAGDWSVEEGSIHRNSGDGPTENPANYPRC